MMTATMRIFDFYQMRGNKIRYNWMLIDTVDLMLQAGTRALPKVKVPIKLSNSTSKLNIQNKFGFRVNLKSKS